MTSAGYPEYIDTFRAVREAFSRSEPLRLHAAVEQAAASHGLARAARDMAVWDAAQLSSPRAEEEFQAAISGALGPPAGNAPPR